MSVPAVVDDRPGAFPGDRQFRVAEVFGPTIQGEGPAAGMRAFFVRFGGCDYRCSWCDSPHAVLPERVARLDILPAHDIVLALDHAGCRPGDIVVLSGGNPALLKLHDLVAHMQLERQWRVHVETQGTVWQDWLTHVDMLVVSPKPPSAGRWLGAQHPDVPEREAFAVTATRMIEAPRRAVKIVVGDDADYQWARRLLAASVSPYAGWPLAYLSALTPPPSESARDLERLSPDLADGLARNDVGESYRRLCERVAKDTDLSFRVGGPVRVLPQLHVIAWGHALGR